MSKSQAIASPVIEHRDPRLLIPYELNAKKHDPAQVARICRAIISSGKFDVPIVVDRHGVIIKGHGRHLAALELELPMVPIIVHKDLSPEQVKAARLADNRVALSDIDTDMMRASLADMDTTYLDGIYDDKELNYFEADLGAMTEGAFVSDMDLTLAEQRTDLDERADKASKERVPLSKAFGIKDIPGHAQILISRLMAKAEALTGKTGSEALTDWIALKVPA